MAITPTFCCGFECGVDGPHLSAISATYNTGTVNNGLRSGRCNPTASTQFFQTNVAVATITSANGIGVARFYIRFATLPSADTYLYADINGSTTANGLWFQNSSSKIFCKVNATASASGVSVTTGVWYLIDVRMTTNAGANAIAMDAEIGGTSISLASTSTTPNNNIAFMGAINTCTADVFYDDMVFSTTSGDYPIGAGKVLGFVPASDGTHTSATTEIVKGTLAAPTGGGAITSATTDSFNWVNGRPMLGGATDNTRLINQQTAASTHYVEHGIEQTTEVNAPRAVEVAGFFRHAGAQACNSQFKVNDNGTEAVVFNDTGNTNTVDVGFTKQFATMPADSATWTLARFKALKLRFGYSSDATPDVYNRGWMVEAEFALSTSPNLTPPIGSLALAGVGGALNFGIPVPTEVNIQ